MRIVIVIKRVDQGRYQASLRAAAGGNVLFFSRRQSRASSAKRDAEILFGPLKWREAPAALRASEPEVGQVAYVNWTKVAQVEEGTYVGERGITEVTKVTEVTTSTERSYVADSPGTNCPECGTELVPYVAHIHASEIDGEASRMH